VELALPRISWTRQIGGYARGYHDLFSLLAAWQQIPLRPRWPVRQPVFLCIGALVAKLLICREWSIA